MKQDSQDASTPTPKSPILILHWRVLEEVINTIGRRRAESGGVIGGNGDGTEVSHYHFDESSRNSAVTYSPDYELLNHLFKSQWNPKRIRLRGFIHSHPGRGDRPSCGDEVYAERILGSIEDLECLWLPIVNTIPDTRNFRLTPWGVYPAESGVAVVRGRVQVVHVPISASLEVCGEAVLESIKRGELLDEIVCDRAQRSVTRGVVIRTPTAKDRGQTGADGRWHEQSTKGPRTIDIHQPEDTVDLRNTFNRVEDAYDLALMNQGRAIAVGAGGAASWLEELARAGLGQFVIIDPDVVAETNLATQQTYRRDIGRPKVDCIAERIRDINPTAKAVAIHKSLDDLTDDEIRRLALDPIDGREVSRPVICGLTDEFFAQARVNRIALQLGLPSLCAQVYKEGRGAEITFTYPGVTRACHRCILSSRYRHFLEEGRQNNVTSRGAPIFSTTRLNAIKGFLMLALFHHGSPHPRWGHMLSRIGNRNLIQVRMDPDFSETMGISVFDQVFRQADHQRLFFDEVVWLPQKQECPETGHAACPDCGGTGDLRDAIGKFRDTKPTSKVSISEASELQSANANVRCSVEVHVPEEGSHEKVSGNQRRRVPRS